MSTHLKKRPQPDPCPDCGNPPLPFTPDTAVGCALCAAGRAWAAYMDLVLAQEAARDADARLAQAGAPGIAECYRDAAGLC